MLASENIMRTDVNAYAIRVAYNGISNSTKTTDDDKAAIGRELIYGNIAGIRQKASNANNLISKVQTLDAAATISEKLGRMKALAEQRDVVRQHPDVVNRLKALYKKAITQVPSFKRPKRCKQLRRLKGGSLDYGK